MSTDGQKDREKWQKNVFISPSPPLPSLRLVLGEEMPRCRFIPRFFLSISLFMQNYAFLLLLLPFVLRWVFIENNKIAADKDLPGRPPRRRVRDPIPSPLPLSPAVLQRPCKVTYRNIYIMVSHRATMSRLRNAVGIRVHTYTQFGL